MTAEERIARRAAIEQTRSDLGAVAEHAWEPRDSCVFLTSIENRFAGRKGGVTMQVGKRQAAVHIVDNTHRLSTEEEIEAYHQDDHDRYWAGVDAENKANRRTVVYTEPPARPDGAEMPNSSATKEQ